MADRIGYTAAELAAMKLPGLSCAENKVRARAKAEAWPATTLPRQGRTPPVKVYALATMPEWIRDAIAAHTANTATTSTTMVEAKPEHARIAHERLGIVERVVELVKRGDQVSAAIDAVRGAHSARSVRRWYDAVRNAPRHEWIRLLVPAWRGPTATSEMSEDAFQWFCSEYLTSSRPAASECYKRTVDVAKARGWTPIPGFSAFVRRFRKEVPATARIVKREGKRALERVYPALERDKSDMVANSAWNSDGHVVDVMVLWPDGTIERPTLVGFQDVAYGAVLGWRIDRTENADVIRLAFADSVIRYGLPGELYFDNGRAFASNANTGGCHWRIRNPQAPGAAKGVFTVLVGEENIRWVLPGHGQSKPIERAWRDLCETVSRHPLFVRAYVGSRPDLRGHDFDKAHAIPLDVFVKATNALIQDHNERTGRRSKMARGGSLLGSYLASLATIERRVLHPDQERLLWLSSEPAQLRQDTGSLFLFGNRYWTEPLIDLKGQIVTARFDPDALHDGVHVYLANGKHVAWAPCVETAGFGSRQAARNHTRARAAFVRANSDAADILTRHSPKELGVGHLAAKGVDVSEVLAPPPSVIRPNFGAPRLTKAAALIAEEETTRRARQLSDDDEIGSLFEGAFDDLTKKTAND